MKYFLFVLPAFLLSCGQAESIAESTTPTDSAAIQPIEYLLSSYTHEEELYFTDQNGNVVIPEGKYMMTTSDTIRQLGFVVDEEGHWWGINSADSILFEVYNFDNGPDYVEEGLFRIVKDSLIGYADESGNVVIDPQYKCAWPFEEGSAKVSLDCEISTEFEMTKWESENWFYIDKEGYKVKPGTSHRLPNQE